MRTIGSIVVVALLSGIGWVWYSDPLGMRVGPQAGGQANPEPAGMDEGPYLTEVMQGRVIQPGTVVGTTAPRGWTHLVIKSRPRIASGAIEKLSDRDRGYATFMFMTTVARVGQRQDNARTLYVLDEVACGLGTDVNGQDVILSPNTQKQLGADLGLIYRMILGEAYKQQLQVQVLARSPTFWVQDTPAVMHRQGDHKDVLLRYCFLVDPVTGRLDSLVCLIDRSERPDEVIGAMEWLLPTMVAAPPLHVHPDKFILGQPTAHTFAVEGLPPGKHQLPLPGDLKHLAALQRYTPEQARQLHQALRQLTRAVANP